MDKTCFGEKQVSADDVAALENAKTFELQAGAVKVSSPIRNLAETRAGIAKTFAEVNAEKERQQQELQKKLQQMAKDANERIKTGGRSFLTDAPAAGAQEGFCAALNGVMAAARDDFKSIRAQGHYGGFSSRINIPGSGQCEIDVLGYRCATSFKLREVADKQMESLARSVGKCLPGLKAERSAGNDGLPTVEFENKTSTVGITLHDMKEVGGYDVTLSVDHY